MIHDERGKTGEARNRSPRMWTVYDMWDGYAYGFCTDEDMAERLVEALEARCPDTDYFGPGENIKKDGSYYLKYKVE